MNENIDHLSKEKPLGKRKLDTLLNLCKNDLRKYELTPSEAQTTCYKGKAKKDKDLKLLDNTGKDLRLAIWHLPNKSL